MSEQNQNNEVYRVIVSTCFSGYELVEANGTCSSCGSATLNGEAAFIECFASPESCEECGQCHCDGSC